VNAFKQMMEEYWVSRPRVRSPQKDNICLLGLLKRVRAPARSEYRRQTDDAGSVSRPVAAIDVVAADRHTSELLRYEVHLVRALGATEQAKRLWAMLVNNGLQTHDGSVQCLVPTRRSQTTILANERLGQTRIRSGVITFCSTHGSPNIKRNLLE
jgi:hypothetical protein